MPRHVIADRLASSLEVPELCRPRRALRACGESGIEGIVLKRRDSRYWDGQWSDAWRKMKCPDCYERHRQYRYHRVQSVAW